MFFLFCLSRCPTKNKNNLNVLAIQFLVKISKLLANIDQYFLCINRKLIRKQKVDTCHWILVIHMQTALFPTGNQCCTTYHLSLWSKH